VSGDAPTIAFVLPTKDRPDEIRTMLRSLEAQDARPAQVIVVDSSAEPSASLPGEFPSLPIEFVRFEGKPSAAAQRNEGASRVSPTLDLICFFDDDQVLLDGALGAMLRFWSEASPDVAGAGFNLVNEIDTRPALVKRSRLAEWLGLYSRTPGAVAPSGWQALPGVVEHDLDVEWLTTGAVIWRREVLDHIRFDEFFDGYSYLEDLDFSYSVSREHRLVLVAAAHVHHFPSKRGRMVWRRFGQIEVRNRLYFVRKHGLSVVRCFLGLGVRFLLSLGLGVVKPSSGGLSRAWGNVTGLFRFAGAGPVA